MPDTHDWTVERAYDLANTIANHGWAPSVNSDLASECIYALCRKLRSLGNAAAMRAALEELVANIEMRSTTFGLNVMVDTKTFLDAKAALAAPPEPPSNAAALRAVLDILEKLVYAIPYVYHAQSQQNEIARLVRIAENEVRTALAAPARNCDRTKDEAESAFKAKFGRPWTAAEDELATWLFAENTSFRDAAVKQANKLANELRNLLD